MNKRRRCKAKRRRAEGGVRGDLFTITGCYAVPEPEPPKLDDRITIEGCDTAFRVVEVSNHEGIYSCRLEPIDAEMV